MSGPRFVIFVFVALLGLSCRTKQPASVTPSTVVVATDPHSYSRPHEVTVRHTGLSWDVSFAAKHVAGSATLVVDRHDPKAPLVLDTRGLEIDRVQTGRLPDPDPQTPRVAELGNEANWQAARWTLGESDPVLGQALSITLAKDVDLVRVFYRTSATASGLQWLAPAQTADKSHPFLYSQAQAIHARSFVPCQDSPAVRMTYDAVIRVDDPALTPLMAAQRVAGKPGAFVMPQPISAYLVAFAVGKVEFAELGPRTGVWAEPSVLSRAVAEFGDVEAMLTKTEALYGPYRWGRYDILVLPPAFPFGGMENPRLTFATPTILAGDRSLIALIAHELAHSWSGNLVTNATWADLWLNEGFTVYIERRITEALYGRDRSEMEAMLGRQDLEHGLAALGKRDQHLAGDLRGRDPDDGMNDIPYEKGALFLRLLEETYGREVFDPFLLRWFEEHAFGTVTTAQFESFLAQHLFDKSRLPGKPPVDSEAWIHGPGVGPAAPAPRSPAFEKVDVAIEALLSGTVGPQALEVDGWTPHQWLHFLRGLDKKLPVDRLAALDAAFKLTESGNYEIVHQWLVLSIGQGYRAVDARLERFLKEVGRRKFLTPLYRALMVAGRSDDARRIYAAARDGYHPITQRTLDQLVGSAPAAGQPG